ncbi:hypothetical protein E3O21_11655 [Cryobacterium flavum]|nr:hypothetical protein [Cryobacterium flavum]TFB76103.1 hypothetical protein E3O21_11655 [Cryobacterium flavum]
MTSKLTPVRVAVRLPNGDVGTGIRHKNLVPAERNLPGSPSAGPRPAVAVGSEVPAVRAGAVGATSGETEPWSEGGDYHPEYIRSHLGESSKNYSDYEVWTIETAYALNIGAAAKVVANGNRDAAGYLLLPVGWEASRSEEDRLADLDKAIQEFDAWKEKYEADKARQPARQSRISITVY